LPAGFSTATGFPASAGFSTVKLFSAAVLEVAALVPAGAAFAVATGFSAAGLSPPRVASLVGADARLLEGNAAGVTFLVTDFLSMGSGREAGFPVTKTTSEAAPAPSPTAAATMMAIFFPRDIPGREDSPPKPSSSSSECDFKAERGVGGRLGRASDKGMACAMRCEGCATAASSSISKAVASRAGAARWLA
jgi:hypothetical protein